MSFPILAPFDFFMFLVLIMNIQLGLLYVYTCFSSFIAAAIHFLLNSGVIPAKDHRKFVLCLVKDNYLTEKIIKAALYLCEIFRYITMETLLHHNRSRSPGLQQCCTVCVCVCVCAVCARAILWYERLYICSDATRAIHFKKLQVTMFCSIITWGL